MNGSYDDLAKFIFETGILSRFKRSGFDFLGTGEQNIASHIFRTAVIGYAIASMNGADVGKTVLLCLFHDMPETRTGDINKFQQKYVVKNEKKAVSDMFARMPNPEECESFIEEFNNGSSMEALIARDADVLELLFTLKEELDNGNKQAALWINGAMRRLKTKEALEIAEKAVSQKSYDWWSRK